MDALTACNQLSKSKRIQCSHKATVDSSHKKVAVLFLVFLFIYLKYNLLFMRKSLEISLFLRGDLAEQALSASVTQSEVQNNIISIEISYLSTNINLHLNATDFIFLNRDLHL